MSILTALKSLSPTQYLIIGLGLLVGFLSINLYTKNLRIEVLKNEVDKVKIEVDRLNLEKTALIDTVNKQNSSILAMQSNAEKYTRSLASIIKQNESENIVTLAMLKQINETVIPKDCEGSTRVLNKFINEHSSEWNKK